MIFLHLNAHKNIIFILLKKYYINNVAILVQRCHDFWFNNSVFTFF